MAHYVVKYQLNNQKDYPQLWAEMEALGAHKAMRSFYLLDYGGSARQLANHLIPFIDADDMLFVAALDTRPASHKCYQGTADWISARF